ncbi:MAG: hypothetical protein JO303_11745 [Caulobacteraceae bacterium]|nr:hypothetical protein [Caulobacteraceae bacterium]
MTAWTVQCGYAAYYANVVTVEADTLAQALEAAIEAANDDPHWKALDHCGPTFVDAAAEGADADPWRGGGYASALPIPACFTEAGEPPLATLIMDGGLIHEVRLDHGACRIAVHDYDVEGVEPERLERDAEGRPFLRTLWGAWPDEPPPDPALPSADPGGG